MLFGVQVGYRKCVRWLQEASWAEQTKLFGGLETMLKIATKKGTENPCGNQKGAPKSPPGPFGPSKLGPNLRPQILFYVKKLS